MNEDQADMMIRLLQEIRNELREITKNTEYTYEKISELKKR
jgi:hypothetical protein